MNSNSQKILALISLAVVLFSSSLSLLAQDARELKQEKAGSKKLKGEHPLVELMRSRKSSLKPELAGVHPRVYVTDEELDQLRVRARSTHKDLWQRTLANVRALSTEPAAPPAQKRRAQNDVGLAIAEAAFVYKIEQDKKYLAAAKKFMDAAVSYDIWGYANNKPNVDLAAGHLLYGLGLGYDLLYNDLSESERAVYRDKLVKQARLMVEYFKSKSGKTYAYSQNHTFIPIAGLGVTAYALYGEVPEAAEWASLSRAIFDRVLATYSQDGYYYEGFEYWIFSTPWLVHYLDAHAHATGEDLYDHPGFQNMYKYVAHSMLPDGKYVFDFGDIFEGPLTRAGKGEEYPRTHPGGHFNTNYNLLYRLAQRFRSGEAQGVAEWLKSFNQVNAEDYWSLVWYEPGIKAVPLQQQPTSYHFKDHDVFFWRSDWTTNATAFAFKCGPSEGHHTLAQLEQVPEWRLSSGHAHPDANSFIIFAAGQYLTGDTGYAGIPLTTHHNTLLFDGKGQAKEGAGHDVFTDVSYERLNQIRIVDVKLGSDSVVVRGDATSAYEPEVGVKKFVREFEYRPGVGFAVRDEVELAKPSVVTSVLHADGELKKESASKFSITAGNARMLIQVVEPEGMQTTIEPNVVTAPGPPGAVDKGERQERGQKLTLSTAKPVTSTRIVINLKVAGGNKVTKS
ncbi:MAG: hypothetical protein DMF69_11140 [Acidobacteria bacterium]|nr:MAG: hypothetical protein DMF69_11140 [Acidobacteriota bacterium]